MNNIVIFLFCLLCQLIIPVSTMAENYSNNDLSDICREFTSIVENSDTNEAQIKDIPFKTGLLWKAESPEGKINYLFGTMHSQDYAVSGVPAKVRLALVKSKTLLMETIPNEAANQAFLNMMYFKDEQRLDSLLEAELFEELKIKIQGYGVTEEHVNFIKPWAAFSLIGRPKPVRAPTLESNLLQIAQRSIIQVKSMQTMEEILSELEGLSMQDQIIILKDTICNHEQIIRDTKTLVDLYIHRDLAGMVEFNNQAHYDEAVFERFMQRILYNRNIKILKKIEIEFKNGNVFVAIGAAHLAEEKGLLQLLKEKHYEITRIY